MADGGIGVKASGAGLRLGDPAPWFAAATIHGGQVALHVDAGRWVVLAFIGALHEAEAREALSQLLAERDVFSEDHIVCYIVLSAPPSAEEAAMLSALVGPQMNFIADYDGAIARRFGADGRPRTIVLDAMLRAVADIGFDHAAGHGAVVQGLLRGLPSVAESMGVAMTAPVLIVPRVFEFELCDLLVELFDQAETEDSGFLLDQNGVTSTVLDPALKRRRDLAIGDRTLQQIIGDRIVARVLPAIERYFNFSVTRMDRTMVSCYSAETGGHFFRHRDNVNAGAAHRRFAMTIGLNKDFTGGALRFPEFGPGVYQAPVGGAVIFSCGMLHEIMRVETGRRYVFVPFLYSEADAQKRLENNALLASGESVYSGQGDQLVVNG